MSAWGNIYQKNERERERETTQNYNNKHGNDEKNQQKTVPCTFFVVSFLSHTCTNNGQTKVTIQKPLN